jgi:hypothetical protein
VLYSSNARLCAALVSSHCAGKAAAGQFGGGPGLGRLFYGVAVTMR